MNPNDLRKWTEAQFEPRQKAAGFLVPPTADDVGENPEERK
uniref:Uncharacterized protein n=1 Tax=uncultured Armatimonadetes bacterium TaxID=157466 RepID=A0A6J4I387_9BACT|nr:hypothetical protein AVDCRST_MAG63-1410 [uncultured Armatimonadetes bacterium]